MLPSNSNNGHDHPGSLLFPRLQQLRFEGCQLSVVSDFLTNLDCVSTLCSLNLSGSSFDSLPACITKFHRLDYLDLSGCKRLRDISELPPNILEQKDTPGRLFKMHLSNCNRLMDNLGMDLVSKMAKALPYPAGACRLTSASAALNLKAERIGLVVCVVFELTQVVFDDTARCFVGFVIGKRHYYCNGRCIELKATESSAHDHVLVHLTCFAFKELEVLDPVVRVCFGGHGLLLKSFGVHLANMKEYHVSGEDLERERYRQSNASISNQVALDTEGATVASLVSDDSNSGEVHGDHHDGEQEQEQEQEPHLPTERFEDLARQTNISTAVLAFLGCFGITCL